MRVWGHGRDRCYEQAPLHSPDTVAAISARHPRLARVHYTLVAAASVSSVVLAVTVGLV